MASCRRPISAACRRCHRFAFILTFRAAIPGLPPKDQFLFATGGTGFPSTLGPDTRITNVSTLLPGPFQMTGPTMPYDAYHGRHDPSVLPDVSADGLRDRQRACVAQAIRPGACTICNRRSRRPTRLRRAERRMIPARPWRSSTCSRATCRSSSGSPTSTRMSDNYHQPVMGGTGPDSVPLGFADQVFFSDGDWQARPRRPQASIYNPDPQAGHPQSLYDARAMVQLLGPDRARASSRSRIT